jgi:tagatose-1,6-bisphosphate aldolase
VQVKKNVKRGARVIFVINAHDIHCERQQLMRALHKSVIMRQPVQDFKHDAASVVLDVICVLRRGECGEDCVKRGETVAKECGVLVAVHHLRVTRSRGE